MKNVIGSIFDILSTLFDKVPLLNKLKGYRSAMGLVGLAVISILQMKGIGDHDTLSQVELGLLAFTGLSLNSSGRS